MCVVSSSVSIVIPSANEMIVSAGVLIMCFSFMYIVHSMTAQVQMVHN